MLLKNSDIKIIPAHYNDLNIVYALLKNASLPYEDVESHFNHFLTAKIEGNIIATIGMEVYQNVALLRSFFVIENMRKKGIGKSIYNELIKSAKSNKIHTLYLLTETAENFFIKNGFQKIERKHIPKVISETDEFKKYCASTAILMEKEI